MKFSLSLKPADDPVPAAELARTDACVQTMEACDTARGRPVQRDTAAARRAVNDKPGGFPWL